MTLLHAAVLSITYGQGTFELHPANKKGDPKAALLVMCNALTP
jgi:hypothetical protein